MTAIPALRVEDEDEYKRNSFWSCDKERGGDKVSRLALCHAFSCAVGFDLRIIQPLLPLTKHLIRIINTTIHLIV